MKEEHQEVVIDRMEQIYGNTNKEAEFVERIREIALRIAEDCYQELASDMEYLKEGSFLEEFDELNIGVHIRETLENSITYTVLKQCVTDEKELSEEAMRREQEKLEYGVRIECKEAIEKAIAEKFDSYMLPEGYRRGCHKAVWKRMCRECPYQYNHALIP